MSSSREVEIRECLEIIRALAAAGVTVRVEGGRVVFEGDPVGIFADAAIATLTGRARSVERALALAQQADCSPEAVDEAERERQRRLAREGGRSGARVRWGVEQERAVEPVPVSEAKP